MRKSRVSALTLQLSEILNVFGYNAMQTSFEYIQYDIEE